MDIAVFWFRRDLRLEDNTALNAALNSGLPVLPIFIFDTNILDTLPEDDARLNFIYDQLQSIHQRLCKEGSSLLCFHDTPEKAWKKITSKHTVKNVFFNRDYEPYALERDQGITTFLQEKGIAVNTFKDHVIFEPGKVLKDDETPYTIYTPFKNKWLKHYYSNTKIHQPSTASGSYLNIEYKFPPLEEIGFNSSPINVKDYSLSQLTNYHNTRDFPAMDSTSYLSPHLRFGTISVRQVIEQIPNNETFLNELIWREFFIQILYHFPQVIHGNFKTKYNAIDWRNNEAEFEKWCKGETGYPIVDAGMRQLNATGYMHNRVRMITASFLCKHLLINWQWGEAYFAEKLLDFELASNNGNWQWVAGTGCDAAPYFRVFNPSEQQRKFDKNSDYTRKWVPEYGTSDYPEPMVDHAFARKRAIATYKEGLESMVS